MGYRFSLNAYLPKGTDAATYLNALYEAGCSDALVGLGQTDRIVLEFDRDADSLLSAVTSAIQAVQQAIPGVRFDE